MSNQDAAAQFPEVSALQLKAKLDAGESVQIIDVREPQEFAVCRIPNSVLLPLMELPTRMNEIDPDLPTVVHCKFGSRSFQAMVFLRQNGFGNVANLTGGIVAWAEQVEPTLPRYW